MGQFLYWTSDDVFNVGGRQVDNVLIAILTSLAGSAVDRLPVFKNNITT